MVSGVKGGPLSARAERESASPGFSESFSAFAVGVRGAVGTRQVIGTSEWT